MREDERFWRVKGNLKSYLLERGFDLTKPFRCPDPTHRDEHPSASYYEKANVVKCFGCGNCFDIYNLISFDYNLPIKEAIQKAYEMYGETTKKIGEKKNMNKEIKQIDNKEEKENKDYSIDIREWNNALLNNEQALDYLKGRGISKDTVEKYKLGYNEDYNCIVIPTSNYSYCSRLINPKDDKQRYYKQGQVYLLNQSALYDTEKYCIIAEGEFDCLSFLELGYNAIGLGSISNWKKIFDKDLPEEKVYILALDNDEEGEKTCKNIITEFKGRNLSYITLNYGELYKDPNEALTTNAEGFKSVCESVINSIKFECLEKYQKLNCLNMLDEFDKFVEQTKDMKPCFTGFNELDKILDDGLKPGVTTLLAVPGVGKTTLCLQIADNVAKSGRDVLIFALEMSKFELMSKSLSRLSYELKTRRGGQFINNNTFLYGYKQKELSEDMLKHMENCKEEYKKFAKNEFVFESNSDMTVLEINKKIREHINITGNIPLVIIDYAQIITPLRDSMSEKQSTDHIILELKRLTRDLFLPILCISSINRQSYESCVGMSSAKESGAIEFTSSVLLGLQYKAKKKDNKWVVDLEEEGKKDIKELELKVIKNRFGRAYQTVDLKFYSEVNYFEEIDYRNDNMRTRRTNF